MATLKQIVEATSIEDFIAPDASAEETKRLYNMLLRVAHPDQNLGNEVVAREAFIKVTQWFEVKYGKPTKQTGGIASKKGVYSFGNAGKRYVFDDGVQFGEGVAFFDTAFIPNESTVPVNSFLCFPKKGSFNNTFLEKTVELTKAREGVDSNIVGFFPEVVDKFKFRLNNDMVAAVSLRSEEPFTEMFSLKEVLGEHKGGLSAQNFAWIYRRMLMILSETHKAGFSCGKLGLESFLVHPARHGVVLIDWFGLQKVDAGSSKNVFSYDVAYMAQLGLQLVNKFSYPNLIMRNLKGTSGYPPEDAVTALEEFDDVVDRVWSDRVWSELLMPNR